MQPAVEVGLSTSLPSSYVASSSSLPSSACFSAAPGAGVTAAGAGQCLEEKVISFNVDHVRPYERRENEGAYQ